MYYGRGDGVHRTSRIEVIVLKSKYPFVEVIWWDASDYPGSWTTLKEAIEFGERPTEVVDYGYLVHKGKSYVVLAGGFINKDEPGREELTLSRVTKIPRPWVRKVSTVKARRKSYGTTKGR